VASSFARDKFDLGYSIRYGVLSFYDIQTTNEKVMEMELERLNKTNIYHVLEHGLFYKIKFGKFSLMNQIMVYQGLNSNGTWHDAVQQLNASVILGIQANLDVFRKKHEIP
jgi:hypothetical protein